MSLDAKHYREHSSTQSQRWQSVLDSLEFTGSESILDLGCGDGRMSATLSKQLPQGQIVGIDPSFSMIELATASFPPQEFPNVHFIQATAEEMQIEQQFDLVLIMNALHWFRDPKQALRNVWESLKLGGSCLILTYPKESPYWHFLEKTLSEKKWESYRTSTTMLHSHEYQNALEEQGFIIETSSVNEQIAIYQSSEDLCKYMKGWLPCYVSLPSDQEKHFLLDATKHALAQSVTSSDTEIHLPFYVLTIKATKPN